MTAAKKYLEILREREPQLWKEPLKESGFTEKDLPDIEKDLHISCQIKSREEMKKYIDMKHYELTEDFERGF